MVIPIFGALILLGFVAFLGGKQKDGLRPLWHWITLAISTVLVIAVITVWLGGYRFERGQRTHIPN
ncbi:MAG TPA: hypothetical protein VGD64_12460 [Acidisarcina sp.]